MKYDYKDDAKIDPDALDVEWLNQPMMFMKWARLLAIARKELNRVEEKIKIHRSNLILTISKNSKVYFGDRNPTAALVEAEYRTDERYKKLKQRRIRKEHNVNVLEGLVEALRQRRYALQDLVQLHGQSYFAGPLVPRDLSLENQKKRMRKETHDVIGKRLNKKGKSDE